MWLLRFLAVFLLCSLITAQDEECSSASAVTADDIIRAVCSFSSFHPDALSFRNETRFGHGAYNKTDAENRYTVVLYFDPILSTAPCASSCEGVSRENVTWCVRITDPSRYIETCVHLDENQELVFESTCDAQSLNLQEHLSLPTDEGCYSSSGCLGLTNLPWIFKGAYLTCITETQDCRDVSFSSIIARPNSNSPPVFSEITQSPLVVRPSGYIVLHAEILTSSLHNSVIWSHSNINFTDPIREDPICNNGVDCGFDTHPNSQELRMNRIRSYLYTRLVSQSCVGGPLYSVETYLYIENSTCDDEGLYSVTLTSTSSQSVYDETREIMVNVEIPNYVAICSTLFILSNKGSSAEWYCQFVAPRNSLIGVALNNTFSSSSSVSSFNITGERNLEMICAMTEDEAYHYVEEDKLTTCYTNTRYTIHVIVCSVEDNTTGKYHVTLGNGRLVEGSGVTVKYYDCDETSRVICSSLTVAIAEGSNTKWQCQVVSPLNTHITVLHNNSVPISLLPSNETDLDIICASLEPRAFYFISHQWNDRCYSHYTLDIVLCSVEITMAGKYHVTLGKGRLVEGSGVTVKYYDCDETSRVICSSFTVAIAEGRNTKWQCQVVSPLNTHISVLHNNTVPIFLLPSNETDLDIICASLEPRAFYFISHQWNDRCYSHYTLDMVLCSVEITLAGNYSIVSEEGETLQGSEVSVQIEECDEAASFKATCSNSTIVVEDSQKVSPVVYAIPIAVLIVIGAILIVTVLIIIARMKTKNTKQRLTNL